MLGFHQLDLLGPGLRHFTLWEGPLGIGVWLTKVATADGMRSRAARTFSNVLSVIWATVGGVSSSVSKTLNLGRLLIAWPPAW